MARRKGRGRHGSAAEHSCEATLRLAAVIRLCEQTVASGGQHLLAGRVLELADPGHLALPPDPRADPLTGCLPVTPD